MNKNCEISSKFWHENWTVKNRLLKQLVRTDESCRLACFLKLGGKRSVVNRLELFDLVISGPIAMLVTRIRTFRSKCRPLNRSCAEVGSVIAGRYRHKASFSSLHQNPLLQFDLMSKGRGPLLLFPHWV